MKEFNKIREEVVDVFNKMLEDAWKKLNKKFLVKSNLYHLPGPILKRIINLACSCGWCPLQGYWWLHLCHKSSSRLILLQPMLIPSILYLNVILFFIPINKISKSSCGHSSETRFGSMEKGTALSIVKFEYLSSCWI